MERRASDFDPEAVVVQGSLLETQNSLDAILAPPFLAWWLVASEQDNCLHVEKPLALGSFAANAVTDSAARAVAICSASLPSSGGYGRPCHNSSTVSDLPTGVSFVASGRRGWALGWRRERKCSGCLSQRGEVFGFECYCCSKEYALLWVSFLS